VLDHAGDRRPQVARAVDLLGRRYALAIVFAASQSGAVRFNEFKQVLEGIPPRTLAQRLSELEEAGVLARRVVDSRPPRVEYRLTPRGERLTQVVRALERWAS
jgi:DNA-binding HxlR family transcriptional regulator